MTRMTGTLHEKLCTFMVICAVILLRMGNDTKVVEEIKTDTLCSVFSSTETRAVYEIM